MPSHKAILRDIHDFNLDPKKSFDITHNNGRLAKVAVTNIPDSQETSNVIVEDKGVLQDIIVQPVLLQIEEPTHPVEIEEVISAEVSPVETTEDKPESVEPVVVLELEPTLEPTQMVEIEEVISVEVLPTEITEDFEQATTYKVSKKNKKNKNTTSSND